MGRLNYHCFLLLQRYLLVFYPFQSSLLIFTQALSWLLLKVLEGIFIFGTTDTKKSYQIL